MDTMGAFCTAGKQSPLRTDSSVTSRDHYSKGMRFIVFNLIMFTPGGWQQPISFPYFHLIYLLHFLFVVHIIFAHGVRWAQTAKLSANLPNRKKKFFTISASTFDFDIADSLLQIFMLAGQKHQKRRTFKAIDCQWHKKRDMGANAIL